MLSGLLYRLSYQPTSDRIEHFLDRSTPGILARRNRRPPSKSQQKLFEPTYPRKVFRLPALPRTDILRQPCVVGRIPVGCAFLFVIDASVQ